MGKRGAVVSDQLSVVSEEAPATEPLDETAVAEPDTQELRTQEDRWRAHIGREITKQYIELDRLQGILADKETAFDSAKTAVSDAKAEVAGVNAKLKSYAGQMRDIEKGTFTPPLFDKHTGETLAQAGKAQTVDQNEIGALTPLERLIDYGLTGSMIAALQDSLLAKIYALATVADLERAIATDDWWFKKVKGFGESKVEKLIDTLVLFRKENPLGEADTRPKQCLDHDCQQDEKKGIFIKYDDGGEACPTCGNSKHWQRYEGDDANPE